MAKLRFDRTQIEKLLAVLPSDDSKVTLVKDDGVYLMSFAEKCAPEELGKKGRTVVYARGYNPNPNVDGAEDVWDKSRDAMGGDDGGDDVGTKKEFLAILADSVGDISIQVTETSLSVGYVPKNPMPAERKPWKRYDVFKGEKSGKWRVVDDPAAKKLFPLAFPTKASAQKWARGRKALALPQDVCGLCDEPSKDGRVHQHCAKVEGR